MFLPGLIGVFVGAPLVARELESGTFRFAWTQGRSRVQWIVTKLVLLAIVLTALALAFSALFTWWYGPFDAITGRMAPYGAYEISGLVFAARTLFGFTLGVAAGLLIRRTVPAMAATAAVWSRRGAVVHDLAAATDPSTRSPIIGARRKGRIALAATCPSTPMWSATGSRTPPATTSAIDQLFRPGIAANGGTDRPRTSSTPI